MRSFLLDAMSPSLKECAPSKVRRALVTGFMATLAMPETEERIAQEKDAGEPRDWLIASVTSLNTKEQLQTDALRASAQERDASRAKGSPSTWAEAAINVKTGTESRRSEDFIF